MAYRKLGRTSSQRKAVLRDLTTDLIINEAIVTTEARAKEIRKTVEKMITLVICTHVVKQLHLYVTKLHLKAMMKQLINIHQQLLFKNFSQKSHLVMLNVTVDTLVSLKQNHVVAMLPQWQSSNLFNFYQFC